jgi:hypothetical protein
MGKLGKWTLAALALSGSVVCLNMAAANTVEGSVWENKDPIARNATIANEPLTAPDATFTLGTPFALNSNVGGYTIGGFLGSNPGGFSWLTGATRAGDDLGSTYWFFTGNISVTNGETFTVGHDDGLQLEIGGALVVDQPGPTAFVNTNYTWTGASGTYAFQLSYGECCSAPAILETSLPLSTVPEPATWAMMVTGFAGLGLFGYGAKRKGARLVA